MVLFYYPMWAGKVPPSRKLIQGDESLQPPLVPAALLPPTSPPPQLIPRPKGGALFPGGRGVNLVKPQPGVSRVWGAARAPPRPLPPLPSQAGKAPSQPSTHTFSDDFQQLLSSWVQLASLCEPLLPPSLTAILCLQGVLKETTFLAVGKPAATLGNLRLGH